MLRFIKIGDGSFIPAFNLLVGTGIALSMLYLQYESGFKNKDEKHKQLIHSGLLLSILIGFVGAFSFDAYTQNIAINFSNLDQIGLTFFGGLLAGLFVFIVYLKLYAIPILETLNLLVPAFCIAQFFGRLGCFFAGCCFGAPTDSILGVTFPVNSLPYLHYHEQIKIFPTQLFESAFALLLFSIFFFTKRSNSFFTYIISYSVFRFLIEFIRADNRGEILNQNFFTPSQIISIISILISITFIATKNKFQSQL